MYLFPFEKIEKGSNVILYGAGTVGTDYLAQIRRTGYCKIVCILDKRSIHLPQYIDIPFFPPEHISRLKNYDYILLTPQFAKTADEMRRFLIEREIPEEKILFENRNMSDGEKGKTDPRKWGKITYAQHGEDWMIINLFRSLAIEKPSYIDIGAYHPFIYSNTALLYENGSRGINIEANPELIGEFYAYRKDDINLNIGIGNEDGVLPFYMFKIKTLSTFSPKEVEQVVARHNEAPLVVDIPVTTVTNIINKYACGKWPHYMDIDIEGLEFEALSILDFTEGPVAITIEVDKVDVKKLNDMMFVKGYVPYFRSLGNLTYVQKEIIERLICW